MRSQRYQGWKNYQTWNVALWLGNDEGLYEMAHGCRDYESVAQALRSVGLTETPDGVAWDDRDLDLKALDAFLSDL